MAEDDTRKPRNELQLLADWRTTMNSYRYMLVQNLFLRANLQHTHIPRNEEAMSAPPVVKWSIV